MFFAGTQQSRVGVWSDDEMMGSLDSPAALGNGECSLDSFNDVSLRVEDIKYTEMTRMADRGERGLNFEAL